jgi:hypothetical protein
MIDILEASSIIKSNLPGSTIQKSAEYQGQFLFLVVPSDPDEFPIFFSVNRQTKAFRDFSPFDDGNPAEIEKLFLT